MKLFTLVTMMKTFLYIYTNVVFKMRTATKMIKKGKAVKIQGLIFFFLTRRTF